MAAFAYAPDPRERLAAIVDSSDDAIVSKDLNGIIQTWNKGAERVFGYPASEVIGKSITILIPKELLHEEDEILARIRAGQRIDHYETKRRRKDGKLITISLTVSPLRDPNGNIVGASKIARDVSEAAELRAQLRQLNAELEQQVEARTRELRQALQGLEAKTQALRDSLADLESFNAAVSHDLRTPLRAISGLVEILLGATNLSDDQRNSLELVMASAREMTRTTEALLRLSRVQRMSVTREPVDVTALVQGLFERLRMQDPDRTASLEVEPGLRTFADPGMVAVVFENLVNNAWKFSGQKPTVTIEVGRAPHGGRDRFYVRDKGIGFSVEEGQTLFKPFQRLRPEDFEGVGIGLATVQRVIVAHGGTITPEGVEGEGATFWFDFGNAPAPTGTASQTQG